MSNIGKKLLASSAGTTVANHTHDLYRILQHLSKGPYKQNLFRGYLDKLAGTKRRVQYLQVLNGLGALAYNSKGGGMVGISDNGEFLLLANVDWTTYSKEVVQRLSMAGSDQDKQEAAQQLLWDLFKIKLPNTVLLLHTSEGVVELIKKATAVSVRKSDSTELDALPVPQVALVPTLLQAAKKLGELEVAEEKALETLNTAKKDLQVLKSLQELRVSATPYATLLPELAVAFDSYQPEAELRDFLYDAGYDPDVEVDHLVHKLRLMERSMVDGRYVMYRVRAKMQYLLKSGKPFDRPLLTNGYIQRAIEPFLKQEKSDKHEEDVMASNKDKMQQLFSRVCLDLNTRDYKLVNLNDIVRAMGFRSTIISRLIYLDLVQYRKTSGNSSVYKLGPHAVAARDARINWAVHSIYHMERKDLLSLVELNSPRPAPASVPAVVTASTFIATPAVTSPAVPLPSAPTPAPTASVPDLKLPPIPAPPIQRVAEEINAAADFKTVLPSIVIDPRKQNPEPVSKSLVAVAERFMEALTIMVTDLSEVPAYYNIDHVFRACQTSNNVETMKKLGLLIVHIADNMRPTYAITKLAVDAVRYRVDLTKSYISKLTQLQFHALVETAKKRELRGGPPDERSLAQREEHILLLAIRLEEEFAGERLSDMAEAWEIAQKNKSKGRL